MDFEPFYVAPWNAIVLTELCAAPRGLFLLGEVISLDSGSERVPDRLTALVGLVREERELAESQEIRTFVENQRAAQAREEREKQQMSKANTLRAVENPKAEPDPNPPVGTVRDGLRYTAIGLASGETVYKWLAVSAPRPPAPTKADRIAELKAEIDLQREAFDQNESQASFDAWKAAERALEFEVARAEREQIRLAKQRAIVDAPEYRNQLAWVSQEETACRSAYEALVAEAADLVIRLLELDAQAYALILRAQGAAGARDQLRRDAGGHQTARGSYPVIQYGTLGREIQFAVTDKARVRGLDASNLARLVGG